MQHSSNDISPAAIEQALFDALTKALSPTLLEVINDSAKHHGHAGDNGSGATHFHIRISSAAFAGQSRVASHRMVYEVIAPWNQNPIHALQITIL